MRLEILTIVFVDIKDYTVKTSNQSRSANQRLLARFAGLVKPMVRSFNGQVIKAMGDAYLLSFRSPTDSLLCAMAVQDQLSNRDHFVPEEERFQLRFAINTGEVRVDKTDVFGEAVNIASRIETIAEGGEIYFAEAVYLMMNKSEIPYELLGARKMKGIDEEVLVYRVPKLAEVGSYKLGQVADSANDEVDKTLRPMPFGGLALKKVHARILGQGMALDGSFHMAGALAEIHYLARSRSDHFVKKRWWRKPLGPVIYGASIASGTSGLVLSPRTHAGLLQAARATTRRFFTVKEFRQRVLTSWLVLGLVGMAGYMGWRQYHMTQHAEDQAQAMVAMEALGVKKDAAAAKATTKARKRAKARQDQTQKALDEEKLRKRSFW